MAKTENRGGKRPGAGRPRTKPSGERAKARLWQAIRTAEKEGLGNAFDVLVQLAVGDGPMRDQRIPAYRIIADILTKGESQQDININKEQPKLVLPVLEADPAKVVPIREASG